MLVMKHKYYIFSLVLFYFTVFVFSPLRAQSATEVINANGFINHPNVPFDSTATADDITSMYFNPAGIGIHPLQVGYFYGNNPDGGLSDHVAFLNLFNFAFSAQFRDSTAGFHAQKYTIGSGIEINRAVSIGSTYSWFTSNVAILNNYTEWDIGIILRPYSFLSIGSVVRGLNLPLYESTRLKPKLDLGIAIRPIPNAAKVFTLSTDVSISFENQPDIQSLVPRFTAEFVPSTGFTLYGGTVNLEDYFFGIKLAQNITQTSFQGSLSQQQGNFFSGGVLVGQERFQTGTEAIRYFLHFELDTVFTEKSNAPIILTSQKITLFDILTTIQKAADDPQIAGIIITGQYFNGGWAQAEELREEFLRFRKKSDKPIYAFLESGGNKEYYIASVAKTISMPPAATLILNGVHADLYYFRGFLDKLGIEPDFIRAGEYKSGPNTFTHKNSTPGEREQIKALLDTLLAEIQSAILSSRGQLRAEDLDKVMTQGILNSPEALQAGLIDYNIYFSEFKSKIIQGNMIHDNWKIKLNDYMKTTFYDDSWAPKPIVMILPLEGQILNQKTGFESLTGSTAITPQETIKALHAIKENSQIKAVIIRINSPGGTILASDLIWKEIRELHKVKPVIVSLGDVAASGGYYLAIGSDEIVANRTTITGSIGAYTGKASLSKLYKKLGINKESFKSHPKGTIYSETDRFTDEERALIQNHINAFYKLFLDRVQRSRAKLSPEEIEANAGGRVYSGLKAKELGMVDRTGGLNLAIELAKARAGIWGDYVNVKLYSPQRKNFFGFSELPELPLSVKEAIHLLNKQEDIKNDIYFMIPYEIIIK